MKKCINATVFPHITVTDGVGSVSVPSGQSHFQLYRLMATIDEQTIYNTAQTHDQPVNGATPALANATNSKVLVERATSSYRMTNSGNVGCKVKTWEITPRIDHWHGAHTVQTMLNYGTQLDLQAESYWILPTDIRFNPLQSSYFTANYKCSKPKTVFIGPNGKYNYRMSTGNLVLNKWLSSTVDPTWGMKDRVGHTKYLLMQITGEDVWVGEAGAARSTGQTTTAHVGLQVYFKEVVKYRIMKATQPLYDYFSYKNGVEVTTGVDAVGTVFTNPKEVTYDTDATDSVRPVNNVMDGTF